MWYKITNVGQSPLSVGKALITKDPRITVAYYSFDHGLSPAKWDLHISDVRLTDAARFQCHVVERNGRISARSNVKLVVEGERASRSKGCVYTYVLTVYTSRTTIARRHRHMRAWPHA